ncbi:myoneurin-like [Gigantopelta aegis]|uniref:myoneurin-like n=1 Tax=Gigantopelta aegis TaxID=1735272 RepID=UPI001B88E056|nr:myoneurin-like [Gigantopelta aegis]
MDEIQADPSSTELVDGQNEHSHVDVANTDIDDVYQHNEHMQIKTPDHVVYVNENHSIVDTLHGEAADVDKHCEDNDVDDSDAVVTEVSITQSSVEDLSAVTTSHMMSQIHEQHTYTIAPSTNESLDEGETITISLEEATEIILQQQGLQGAVQIAPGTYQILTQQASHDGENAAMDCGIPLHVDADLESYDADAGGEVNHVGNHGDVYEPQSPGVGKHEQGLSDQSPGEVEHNDVQECDGGEENGKSLDEGIQGQGQTGVTSADGDGNKDQQADDNNDQQILQIEGSQTKQDIDTTEKTSAPPKERKPDLSSPITVGDRTEIIINGKKCVLMLNPETNEMCAYPLLPPEGKRKRGRPKKQPSDPSTQEQQKVKPIGSQLPKGGKRCDHTTSSAAEGLLELSNTGPDGVRRSGRMRMKNKVLEDYDVLVPSDGEPDNSPDEDNPDLDPDVTLSGIKRRKVVKETTFSPFGIGVVKRGRGRPRRYPPPIQTTTTSIPAVIIPTANGQTLMMANIQGLQSLQAFQQQVKSLPHIVPKVPEVIDVKPNISDLIPENPPLTIDTANSSILDNSSMLVPASLQSDVVDTDVDAAEAVEALEKAEGGCEDVEELSNQATIIQIPENMLSMLTKKDPVKIGIKASEGDLERLKCAQCGYQACFPHQYQEHLATHMDQVIKCKCCTFLSFEKQEIDEHFKESHPRCYCDVCGFQAEHSYVMKRHMMRHSVVGCTCEMCGRVYKDQYILKMHIKMVHMPAEILFECTICSKKFTRKAHLKRHLRIHEPEKPFKCPHCEYRGCERSDISKHLLIHAEPKHSCEVCGKQFRHIKNKELHVKRHNGQKDYKCGVCGFFGYTFTDIRKHIERKHADLKSLVCEKCGSAFKSEVLLQEHQKQTCELLMIEQALAIATSTGRITQATIQIPSELTLQEPQQIEVDGQQVDITVEQVDNLEVDESMTLGEDEIIAGEHMEDVELVTQSSQVHMDGSTLVEEIQVIPQDELVGRSVQAETMMTAMS